MLGADGSCGIKRSTLIFITLTDFSYVTPILQVGLDMNASSASPYKSDIVLAKFKVF